MQRSIHRLSVSENALLFARFAMRTHSCLACFSVCAVQKVRTQNRASARCQGTTQGELSLSRLGDGNYKQTEVTEKEVTSLPYLLWAASAEWASAQPSLHPDARCAWNAAPTSPAPASARPPGQSNASHQ